MEKQCLLCSVGVVEEEAVVLETARCSLSDRGITEVLAAVLGTPHLEQPELMFPDLCSPCYQLLDLVDTLELKLKLKKGEVNNLYFSSRKSLHETQAHDKSSLTPQQTDNVDISMEPSQYLSPILLQEPELKENINSDTQNLDSHIDQRDFQNINLVEPPKKKERGLLTSTDLKCQVCTRTFEKRRYLMDHLRRVHNSAIHQCSGCKIRFKYREEMVTHQTVCQPYTELRELEREEEDKRRLNRKPVTKRKRNNQCDVCDGYFLTQALLSKHQKSQHENIKLEDHELDQEDETKIEAPVCCPLCEIVINNAYALAIHQSSVHNVERPWTCKICEKTFARHLELDNHRRVHSGEKPFQCDVCGARFNQKQNLHTHVRHIHLGERRYSCDECGAKFRRKRLLDCHVNSKHRGEKPYSCSLCPATFVYPEHVKKHELTHSAEKLPCSECSKTFKNKNSLENHKSVHKPASNYQCLSCPLFYLTREELLGHLRVSGHPKGVFSSSSRDLEVPVEQGRETLTLSFLEEEGRLGAGQVEEKVDTEAFEEEKVVSEGYEDVVFYLSEGLCYTEEGQPVYIAQQDESRTAPEEERQETEVQSAILSIVETGAGP